MRETSSTIFSDGYQTPPNPAWASATRIRPLPMAESSPPSFPEKTDTAQRPFTACLMPVQPLSKELVQVVCPSSAQSLSSEKVDRGIAESGQGMDSHNGHSPDRGNGQGADSVVGQGTSLPDTQPVDTLAAPSEPVFILRQNTMRWTANQGKVLGFFRQYGHCITNLRVIVEKLGIPYGTVRHIIRRLSGAGCIRTKPYNDASVQGIEVWYCGPDDAASQPVMTEASPPVDRAGDELDRGWTAPLYGKKDRKRE